MTISGFQSYSFSAIRLNLTVTTQPGAAQAPAPALAGTDAVDRVTLSSEATTAPAPSGGADAAASEPTNETPAASTPPVPPPSRASRRADALLAALDGDQDGALTADEFTSGALNLLRNAGARRRIDDDDDSDRRETRGLRRLERKLDKAFERVDANDDGAIDKDELTAALARTRGHRHHRGSDRVPPAETPDAEAPAAGATTVSFSVTFVSIAVQRYSAVQGATPGATDVAGAPDASQDGPAETAARAA